MAKRYSLLLLLFIQFAANSYAQTCADYVMQLSATGQVSPPKITLNWKPQPGASSISIFRKTKASLVWGIAIATVTGNSTSYVDNNVQADSTYEYFVSKPDTPAYGYIYAAVKAAPIHNRGAILLVVEDAYTTTCSAELTRLMKDLSGDGWEVIRKDFPASTPDFTIKSNIVSTYNANANLKAVLIVGHIAVPYSGDLNPDAHPDHKGAWPADVYYGDMDGVWTDNTVNNTVATGTRNDNVPSDGKWDQTVPPTELELQVSRIDFNNMPLFTSTPVQLMKSYLNKDHLYKMDSLTIIRRALMDDNFGKFTNKEGFASTALRLSPIVGTDSIKAKDFVSTLNTDNYQWAFGCGAGSYTTCSGIGKDTSFRDNNVKAIFTMLFGSYFGDWDNQNNILRAPLCSNEPALTSCWVGRPHWFFHHMALGENIGYSAMLSQNNDGTTARYTNAGNFFSKGVHIALLGDLSLRTDYIKPPKNVVLTNPTGAGAKLDWTASPDAGVVGYYVYRSATEYGKYTLRSPLVTGTTYTDSIGTDGNQFYMVRAAKLQATPSGSYYNLSIGYTDSQYVAYPIQTSINHTNALAGNISLYPNPAKDYLNMVITASKPGMAEVAIMDQQGRKLMTEHKQLTAGDNTIGFNIKDLPSGLYLLVAKTGDNVQYKKWIKSE